MTFRLKCRNKGAAYGRPFVFVQRKKRCSREAGFRGGSRNSPPRAGGLNRPVRFMAGRPAEVMSHIGGHGLCHPPAPCGLRWTGGKQPQRRICPKHSCRVVRCGSGSGWKTSLLPSSEVLRAALPPTLSSGRDATGGVNRQVYDLRHYPSLAKLGIGRLETRFRVAQSTACLTRGLRVSPENFSFSLF